MIKMFITKEEMIKNLLVVRSLLTELVYCMMNDTNKKNLDRAEKISRSILKIIKQNYIERDMLDKIRAEATSLKISYTNYDKNTYRRGVNDVLKVIDKIQEESEVKTDDMQ